MGQVPAVSTGEHHVCFIHHQGVEPPCKRPFCLFPPMLAHFIQRPSHERRCGHHQVGGSGLAISHVCHLHGIRSIEGGTRQQFGDVQHLLHERGVGTEHEGGRCASSCAVATRHERHEVGQGLAASRFRRHHHVASGGDGGKRAHLDRSGRGVAHGSQQARQPSARRVGDVDVMRHACFHAAFRRRVGFVGPRPTQGKEAS
eukprot:scaffold350_cov333-Pavlova_lutheri.AAC.7